MWNITRMTKWQIFFYVPWALNEQTSEQWHIPLENSRGSVFVSFFGVWWKAVLCSRNTRTFPAEIYLYVFLPISVCLFVYLSPWEEKTRDTHERERLETHLCLCEYLSLIISSPYCMADQSKEEKLSFLNSTWRAVRLVCWWWHFSWMCRCVSAARCEEPLSFSDMIFILRQIWLVYLVLTAHNVYNPP